MLAVLKLGANLHAKCPHNGMTALHTACHVVNPDAADLLLRWGADETAADWNDATVSAVIPRIDEAPEENRPAILRLTKLLKFADKDRTWRRRGLLVMCRAHSDRLRLAADVSNNTAESVGELREGRNCRTKREEERVETATGGGGVGSGSGAKAWSSTARRTGSVGKAAVFEAGSDGMVAWLTTQTNEGVFRNIVRFL